MEALDGTALYTSTDLVGSRDDFYVSARPESWLVPPGLLSPIYTRSGLVERRPEAAYGDPVFGGGRWQAVLDPVELAGPAPQPLYSRSGPQQPSPRSAAPSMTTAAPCAGPSSARSWAIVLWSPGIRWLPHPPP